MKKLFIVLFSLLMASFLLAETVQMTAERGVSVDVLRSNEEVTVLEFRLGSFDIETLEIDGNRYHRLLLEKEGFLLNEHEPELPYIARSIMVPDRAEKEIRFIGGNYQEFEMNIVPSKGNLLRNQDPEQIPYGFSDVYQNDGLYPGYYSELSEPYILRDFRGQTVRAYPFQYNPVSGKLRVYHNMLFEVVTVGESSINVIDRERNGYSRDFGEIYRRRFINFDQYRYVPLEEQGRIIVIAHDTFVDAMQPYVDWKTQKGIRTDIYPVSQVGTNPTAIKSFIQTEYDLNDGLTFVQLVGDAAQIPTFMVGGGGSDPSYSLLAGNDDYPEIFVGRFSAENVSQVETQVAKTINYERDITTTDDWFNTASGIASNEGSNPSDIQHQNGIRTRLLNYTYTHVDQFYAPSATAAQVTSAVNSGRGFMNYTGHGSNTSWSTTGFSNTHVNALTNDFMNPFIVSVACVNGNFTSTTCFAEAWLRATNNTNGNPTGAVAMYASTVNQSWYPPLTGQDEITDLLVEEEMNTIGGLFFNGSSEMMDVWGNQGISEFKNWTIFGDASLQVRSDAPQEMVVSHYNEILIGLDTFNVETNVEDALVSITHDGEIVAAGHTDASGDILLQLVDPPMYPTDLTLTITAYNKVTYITEIQVIPADGAYVVIHEVDVSGSGPDDSVNYGDVASVNIILRNVGVETANSVWASITTDDPYVEVLDNNQFFSNIAPGNNVFVVNAFSLQVADNIPDQHRVDLDLTITDNNEGEWTAEFHFLVNAPSLEAGTIVIDDSQYGNDNGFLEPGETVQITIPTMNQGSVTSPLVNAALISGSPLVTIDSDESVDLGVLFPDDTLYASYTITASEDLAEGSVITLGYLITAGGYAEQISFPLSLGAVVEDFASGSFDNFDWQFSGNLPWIIDSSVSHHGSNSARSGAIGHSQSSGMSVTIDVPSGGEISFYRRVSSEANYDFFRFYINDELQGQWSGEVAWSQVTYDVAAGVNTFFWTYVKDYTVSSGSDCAWVDYIEFPASGTVVSGPIAMANPSAIDFNTVYVGLSATENFWLRNFGDEELVGTIELDDEFELISLIPEIITSYSRNDNNRETYNYVVPPHQNIPFQLIYAPEMEGEYNGEMIITGNSINVDEFTIPITAIAECAAIPPANLQVDQTLEYIELVWETPDYPENAPTFDGVQSKPVQYRDEGMIELLGFNVYRNNELYTDDHIQDNYYHDTDYTGGETYTYYVTAVYNVGESEPSNSVQHTVVSVDNPLDVPLATELISNYPNPFNPETTISYSLKEQSNVVIEVYNILGQKIKTLVNEEMEAGLHSVIWHGTNDQGRNVASGIYFYRMNTNDYNRTRKMIFLK